MTKAGDWFIDPAAFMQVCLDAVSLAKGENAEEFACRMLRDAKVHGLLTPITDRQMLWLCNLADSVMPLKRERSGA